MERDTPNREEQHEITRICISCAILLLQHGAETAVVENLAIRLGRALRMDSVDCAISSNAIVLTTTYHNYCQTSTKKNVDKGVNMYMVTAVQQIVIATEKNNLNYQEVRERLINIPPFHYPRWQVAIMAGIACACFCRLAQGSIDAAITTAIVSSLALGVRQQLAIMQINPLINVGITAFFATLLCGLITTLLPIRTPSIAMACCILFLVPGFPLINAVADMFKNHINTGLSRWLMASLLALTTCIGVILAMTILGNYS